MRQRFGSTWPGLRGSRLARGARPLLAAAALAMGALHGGQAGGLAHGAATEADELIALTNLDRTSNGLPALAVDRRLLELAAERSTDMIARDYFSHSIPPDGRTVFDLMQERDITYRAAGENLGYNTAAPLDTALYVQRAFMDSPTHRSLILSPEFDHVGAAAAVAADSRIFHTVLFVDLGDPGPFSVPAPETDAARERTTEEAEEIELPLSRQVNGVLNSRAYREGTDAAAPDPANDLPGVRPASAPGRLSSAGTRPLGLVEQLVQRTLRLHLGL